MTNQPKDNTNPPQLHQFGSHFRYWREKRGYSLKEAAGDVMSVSQLSKFETEKTSISINKLSDLLMMIGVDLADFMESYPGQKIERYNGLVFTKQSDEISNYYQNFPQYQEYIDYIVNSVKRIDLLIPGSSKNIDVAFLKNILNQPEQNMLELEILYRTCIHNEFPKDLLIDYAKVLKNHLKKATDNSNAYIIGNIQNALTLISFAIQLLSRNGYHQEALDLINYTYQQVSNLQLNSNEYLSHQINLQLFEVFTLIRMGKKTEAFKKRVQATQLLTALANHGPTQEIKDLYRGQLSVFSDNCDALLDGRLK